MDAAFGPDHITLCAISAGLGRRKPTGFFFVRMSLRYTPACARNGKKGRDRLFLHKIFSVENVSFFPFFSLCSDRFYRRRDVGGPPPRPRRPIPGQLRAGGQAEEPGCHQAATGEEKTNSSPNARQFKLLFFFRMPSPRRPSPRRRPPASAASSAAATSAAAAAVPSPRRPPCSGPRARGRSSRRQ